jgi:HAMP domain-containing protein
MASGTARQIAMQTHPGIRMIAEFAFGKDLFTNRPLSEATSSLDAIARAVSGNPHADVPTFPEKLIEAAPFVGRPLYVARSLLDDRGGQPLLHRFSKTTLNALSGIKIRDEPDALADAVRQIEESIDPYTREFKQTYIPEHLQPGVPQWALQRMAVSRALGRERREARKKTASKGKKSKKRKSDTSAVSLFE